MSERTAEQMRANAEKIRELTRIGDAFNKAVSDADDARRRMQAAREEYHRCYARAEAEFGSERLPFWVESIWGKKPTLGD